MVKNIKKKNKDTKCLLENANEIMHKSLKGKFPKKRLCSCIIFLNEEMIKDSKEIDFTKFIAELFKESLNRELKNEGRELRKGKSIAISIMVDTKKKVNKKKKEVVKKKVNKKKNAKK